MVKNLSYNLSMIQLLIIFCTIALTVIVARLISFMVLEWKVLPLNILSNGKRSHHFVWGNILIVVTSFSVIALGINPNNYFILVLYGVGLGLVFDEFPHWVGNTKELSRNVPIIPGAIPIVITLELFILFLIILKYFKIF